MRQKNLRERGEVEADEDMKRVMRNRKTDKILKSDRRTRKIKIWKSQVKSTFSLLLPVEGREVLMT